MLTIQPPTRSSWVCWASQQPELGHTLHPFAKGEDPLQVSDSCRIALSLSTQSHPLRTPCPLSAAVFCITSAAVSVLPQFQQ